MIHEDLKPLAALISELRPMPGNPRNGDVEAIMRSYAEFGQRKPIVATQNGTVIDGNHQLEAAKRLGWTEIAVTVVDDDDLRAKAYALAANKTGQLGSMDEDAIAEILAELVIDEDLLKATAFTPLEVKGILGETVGLADDGERKQAKPSACPSCGFEWRVGPAGETIPA